MMGACSFWYYFSIPHVGSFSWCLWNAACLGEPPKIQVLLTIKCFTKLVILWRAGRQTSACTVHWKLDAEKKMFGRRVARPCVFHEPHYQGWRWIWQWHRAGLKTWEEVDSDRKLVEKQRGNNLNLNQGKAGGDWKVGMDSWSHREWSLTIWITEGEGYSRLRSDMTPDFWVDGW